MREKFIRFMNGRNGMDELARAESWVVMILLVVSTKTLRRKGKRCRKRETVKM